jgi:vacuolar protein sorting-associated protein 8
MRACLRKGTSLSSKQQREIRDFVESHALDLANIGVRQTAFLVADFLPESHELFLSSLRNDEQLQYDYLNSLFEPQGRTPLLASSSASLVGRYTQLMCQQNPGHVAGYVDSLREVNLELRDVLPSMEASGVIDAAVILMARQGQVQAAMNRLIQHLSSLEAALAGLLQSAEVSPDVASTNETIHDLLESIEKYSGVGIWLCQRQTKAAQRSRPVAKPSRRSNSAAQTLSFEETLWLQLINSVVSITKKFSRAELANEAQVGLIVDERNDIASSLRTVVQNVFTALLKATTASREVSGDRQDFSFLQILRAFLTQAAASSPSLAELRAVIGSIFSAYAYEESLLALSNSMLDKDLFVHVDEIARLRRRGWRPRGQVCEICRRRVWGPGAGAQIWKAWLHREEQELHKRQDQEYFGTGEEGGASRGKGKAAADISAAAASQSEVTDGGDSSTEASLGPALVFACRHLFHERCLDHQTGMASGGSTGPHTPLQRGEHLERVCPVCSTGGRT